MLADNDWKMVNVTDTTPEFPTVNEYQKEQDQEQPVLAQQTNQAVSDGHDLGSVQHQEAEKTNDWKMVTTHQDHLILAQHLTDDIYQQPDSIYDSHYQPPISPDPIISTDYQLPEPKQQNTVNPYQSSTFQQDLYSGEGQESYGIQPVQYHSDPLVYNQYQYQVYPPVYSQYPIPQQIDMEYPYYTHQVISYPEYDQYSSQPMHYQHAENSYQQYATIEEDEATHAPIESRIESVSSQYKLSNLFNKIKAFLGTFMNTEGRARKDSGFAAILSLSSLIIGSILYL